jgi:hypothetical protein
VASDTRPMRTDRCKEPEKGEAWNCQLAVSFKSLCTYPHNHNAIQFATTVMI